MGNSLIEKKQKINFNFQNNLTYIKTIYDERYGQIKIVQNKRNKSEILAVKTKTLLNKIEYTKLIQNLKKRKQLELPTLLKLKDYEIEEFEEFCSVYYKVYFIYEFISRTLEDEIEQRKSFKNYFTELELLHLIDCILSALIYFNNSNINHEDIQPHSIFLSNEGIYKLNDIQFMSEVNSYNNFLIGYSESCYLSPELLYSLKIRDINPLHDKQKSQIFSLGITVLECASLSSITNCYNFDSFTINEDTIEILLKKIESLYSKQFCLLLKNFLIINPDKRPNFNEILLKLTPHQIQLKKFNSKNQFFEQKEGDFNIISPEKTIILTQQNEKNNNNEDKYKEVDEFKLYESKYEEKSKIFENISERKDEEEQLNTPKKISNVKILEKKNSKTKEFLLDNSINNNGNINKLNDENIGLIALEIENKFRESVILTQKIKTKINRYDQKKSYDNNEDLSFIYSNPIYKKDGILKEYDFPSDDKKFKELENKKNKFEELIAKDDFLFNNTTYLKDFEDLEEDFDPNYLYELYIQEYKKIKNFRKSLKEE